MLSNIESFNAYIEKAKKRYSQLTMAQEWDDDIWASQGDLAENDEGKSIYFSSMGKTKYCNCFIINNRDYIDWCKAQVVNQISNKSFQALTSGVSYLKHLYFSLVQIKGSGAPWLLNDAVLTKMESNLISGEYVELNKYLVFCINAVKELYNSGIVTVGITFENTHKPSLSPQMKKLYRRRKKSAAIDDNERDGEEHLISMKALHSLAWLTWNAKNEWEQVAIRLYHILIATGFRAGELLRLRQDALVSVAEINETTGKPIFLLDERGKPMLDESGNPEVQLIWGIEYYPEKGHMAKFKWLDKHTAPLVIAAFEIIKKKTQVCREQLKWLEKNPLTPIRWESETISYRDFNKYFLTYMNEPDGQNINWFKRMLKNESGILPDSEIVDTLRIDNAKKTRIKPKQPIYFVADLNRHFSQDYIPTISFKVGGKNTQKQTITIKKSELLCIFPDGALSNLKGNSKISYIYPNTIPSYKLNTFFGASKEKTSEDSSIFNRYGLKEEDGSNIYIRTHMPRHQLNTFLALADVNEHQQALIVGRQDIQQNRNYQHLSLKDKTRYQDTSTENMRQRIKRANQENENSVAMSEPKNDLLAELGITPISSTPSKLAVQQSMHAFNKPDEHVEFMQEALEQDNLLGELQDTFNAIRKKEGLQAAKEFIEVHGRNFHVVINGGCTRNLALHGCDKQMRCLDGEGCFHLMITGRPGELESIQATHQNLLLNVEKMSRLEQAGKLRSRREREALEIEKHNLSQMDVVLRKAENFSGFIPIRVFETTKRLNQNGPKKTVVESFAQHQRELNEENYNG